MNKPLLIGFLVILAIVLGAPLLSQLSKGGGSSATKSGGTASTAAPAPKAPVPDIPPTWNNGNLGGTSWRVSAQGRTVDVSLLPGGRAKATVPIIGAVDGSWNVSGNQLQVEAVVMGNKQKISATIAGDKIYADGAEVQRLQ